MGLDLVELVMRTEEVFGISVPDEVAGRIVTVGDLYVTVCRDLHLSPVASPGSMTGHARTLSKSLNLATTPWTPEDVWATIVAICIDQLQIREDEVKFDARFHDDLGCD